MPSSGSRRARSTTRLRSSSRLQRASRGISRTVRGAQNSGSADRARLGPATICQTRPSLDGEQGCRRNRSARADGAMFWIALKSRPVRGPRLEESRDEVTMR